MWGLNIVFVICSRDYQKKKWVVHKCDFVALKINFMGSKVHQVRYLDRSRLLGHCLKYPRRRSTRLP